MRITKPSREEVLRVAKECGAISKDGFDNVMQGNYVIERFAAAMYAKGAEDMRERCRNLFNDLLVIENYTL